MVHKFAALFDTRWAEAAANEHDDLAARDAELLEIPVDRVSVKATTDSGEAVTTPGAPAEKKYVSEKSFESIGPVVGGEQKSRAFCWNEVSGLWRSASMTAAPGRCPRLPCATNPHLRRGLSWDAQRRFRVTVRLPPCDGTTTDRIGTVTCVAPTRESAELAHACTQPWLSRDIPVSVQTSEGVGDGLGLGLLLGHGDGDGLGLGLLLGLGDGLGLGLLLGLGDGLGLGLVLFLDAAAAARGLARAVAGSAEDPGEDVRLPVDHVRIGVAAGCDEADVFGNRSVGRAGPLAIDNLMEVVGVLDIGRLHAAPSYPGLVF